MNNTEPKHISEFILKWQKSLPQTMRSEFEYDTHALINKKQSEPEPELNPIEQAYERGEKIRHKGWHENSWIQKLSETESIDELKNTYDDTVWAFRTEPHKWEIYTEPTEQKIDQTDEDWNKSQLTEQPAKPFDRDRFERLFSAVVISYPNASWDYTIEATQRGIDKLDAYYKTKIN